MYIFIEIIKDSILPVPGRLYVRLSICDLSQVKYTYLLHRNFFLSYQKQFNPLMTVRKKFLTKHKIALLAELATPT